MKKKKDNLVSSILKVQSSPSTMVSVPGRNTLRTGQADKKPETLGTGQSYLFITETLPGELPGPHKSITNPL